MQHLLANISWSSTGWTEPADDRSEFGYVAEGGIPHECYNFRFEHPRNAQMHNDRDVVYGYVESNRVPREYQKANDGQGICFFSSRNLQDGKTWIVGLYGKCSVVEPRRQLQPAFDDGLTEEFVNLCGVKRWSLAFDRRAMVELNVSRHLAGQKKIGQVNFAKISDQQARAMLSDALSRHQQLPDVHRDAALQVKIAIQESLLVQVGATLDVFRPEPDESLRRATAEAYLEGQQRVIETRVTARNEKLVRRAKERDEYTCQVCGFRYPQKYGERGQGFAESHHLVPISRLTGEQEILLKDVITVCANCHRMLHHGGELLTPCELRTIIGECTQRQRR